MRLSKLSGTLVFCLRHDLLVCHVQRLKSIVEQRLQLVFPMLINDSAQVVEVFEMVIYVQDCFLWIRLSLQIP